MNHVSKDLLYPWDDQLELGIRNESFYQKLQSMAAPIGSGLMVDMAWALAFLRVGDYEEAHERTNAHTDTFSSYVHAIIHRREPDHGNAAYWIRGTGIAEFFDDIADALEAAGVHHFNRDNYFDPAAFNDAVANKSIDQQTLLKTQQVEWDVLFTLTERE